VHRSLRATEGSTPHGRGAGLPPRCQPFGHAGQILRSAPWTQSGQGFRRRLPQEVKRVGSFLNVLSGSHRFFTRIWDERRSPLPLFVRSVHLPSRVACSWAEASQAVALDGLGPENRTLDTRTKERYSTQHESVLAVLALPRARRQILRPPSRVAVVVSSRLIPDRENERAQRESRGRADRGHPVLRAPLSPGGPGVLPGSGRHHVRDYSYLRDRFTERLDGLQFRYSEGRKSTGGITVDDKIGLRPRSEMFPVRDSRSLQAA
jgi:hypothetical protein